MNKKHNIKNYINKNPWRKIYNKKFENYILYM